MSIRTPGPIDPQMELAAQVARYIEALLDSSAPALQIEGTWTVAYKDAASKSKTLPIIVLRFVVKDLGGSQEADVTHCIRGALLDLLSQPQLIRRRVKLCLEFPVPTGNR